MLAPVAQRKLSPERLDFTLPDFTRLSWVSDELRAVWEPRVTAISAAWQEIEWRSVAEGVRRCALTVLPPQEFITRAGKWAEFGLSGLPLETQGLGNYCYSSTSVPMQVGLPFGFRVVVGSPEHVSDFKASFDDADDVAIGKLLGFPDCCQDFFRMTWVEEGLVDTTWSMAVNTLDAPTGEVSVDVEGPSEANILWRWMGIRAVPHLPCKFDCEKTVEFARALIAVGRGAGYEKEMDWLLEILSWPVEWTALHGIAEIKTPVLRVSTRTDATAFKYSVRRNSESYPDDGVQALGFPYRTPKKPILTTSTHFRRGLTKSIEVASPPPLWHASDNGFNSVYAMDRAHKPIVDLVVTLLGDRPGNILDLGCGNGALLQKICADNEQLIPFGIENDANRLEHLAQLLPDYVENFVAGDMFADDSLWPDGRRYSLVLLMPGRLAEADAKAAAKLKRNIAERCDNLVVYAYGDWLTRYGDLRGLMHAVGLELSSIGAGTTAGVAKLPKRNARGARGI